MTAPFTSWRFANRLDCQLICQPIHVRRHWHNAIGFRRPLGGGEMSESSNRVSQHYGSADLENRVLSALKEAGKNLDSLTVEDLAPLDQFHTRGLAATRELVAFAEVKPG